MESAERFDLVLAAAQRGEDRAVAELYRDLHPRLARYLRARAPSAAEDLEGEIWLAIAEGIAGFSGGEEAFRAWVFLIARRRLADLRRTAVRRAALAVPTAESESPDHEGPEAIVLERMSARDAAALITATLSHDQAEVILLRVLADLSVAEVAKLLGKRPEAIRLLQHRGLRNLHAALLRAGVTR
jgi:RNA polymerase sigma-70 factor (ECF subfamily)